jgi:hypothetical protein
MRSAYKFRKGEADKHQWRQDCKRTQQDDPVKHEYGRQKRRAQNEQQRREQSRTKYLDAEGVLSVFKHTFDLILYSLQAFIVSRRRK